MAVYTMAAPGHAARWRVAKVLGRRSHLTVAADFVLPDPAGGGTSEQGALITVLGGGLIARGAFDVDATEGPPSSDAR
jgi:hypothetical protein